MRSTVPTPPLPEYAELQCLSNFSFLHGASHPEELIRQAHQLGYRAIALTDECSLSGIVRAHVEAKECGIKLIVGSRFRLADGIELTLLVMNAAGYQQLSQLITRARRRSPKGQYELTRQDLADGLSGCLALLHAPDTLTEETLSWARASFADRCYLVATHRLRQGERRRHATIEQLSRIHGLPVIASCDPLMHVRERQRLADLLTAIRLNQPLATLAGIVEPNAERHLRKRATLARLFPAHWLEETLTLSARCDFSLDALRYEYPNDDVPEGASPAAYLRQLTEAGMQRLWPEGAPQRVHDLVEYELGIIGELGYEPYFLTVYDIVDFARRNHILCQGRGSAANSAVCYCLGITAVDPSRMETLFERFVSRERGEPPDIDIDFEHERREEVLQYIYQKYGRERAALTATLITYRRRSALRDTGKALGLPIEQIERLTASLGWWEHGINAEHIREAGLDADNPLLLEMIELAGELLSFPRHLSQHVGGFVIARGPLSALVPIENASMPERTVIQWDKDDLDSLRILKIDCLALGMLSAIHRCFDLVKQHHDVALALEHIPADDAAVYDRISRADTVGVFQIESRAQMSMLPRLKPRCFYDLVVEVAIVRPGPIQGQMVHPYLKRRLGLEPVSYPSDAVRQVLERTLGVPIFQEQVIKLAMVAAGFSAGEADQLRRAIGSWRKRERLAYFQERLVNGMRERGYSEAFARQIYNQIQGFGEYGFPESHAASFALLAYASAWLKHHYPAAYLCALLNSQPMGFYSPSQLIQDGRRHGIGILPVDVQRSAWESTLERKGQCDALRLGLHLIRGMPQRAAERLANARQQQAFVTLQDMAHRAALDRRDLNALVAAGATASLAGHRHQARWQALGTQPDLPLSNHRNEVEPLTELRAPSEVDDLVADYASLGLTLGRHPLAFLRERLAARGCTETHRLPGLPHGRMIRLCGLVTIRQHPASAGGTVFITVEDETGSANIIVWERLTHRYRREVLNARLLLVEGELQKEGEVIHVVARRLEDQTPLLGRLETGSRDFR